MRGRVRRWQFLLTGVVALLLLLGLEAYRFVRVYQDLTAARAALLAAEQQLTDPRVLLDAAPRTDARAQLLTGRRRLTGARGALDDDPVLAVAAHLPRIGRQVVAARALTAMGLHLADGGIAATDAAAAAQQVRDQTAGALTQQLVPLLTATGPYVEQAKRDLGLAKAERQGIASTGLLAPLRSAIVQFDGQVGRLDPLLADYDQAVTLAPALLGYDQPRTYLVLAHDSSELMGGGGLILAYGFLRFDRGVLTRVSFDSVAHVGPDVWPPSDPEHYVTPPPPLAKYLLFGWPMGLAEASWWLDFPTEAQQAIQIYHVNSGTDTPIDGVIGVNLFTLQALLKLVGPVTVPQYNETVSADDVVEKTLLITNQPREPGKQDPFQFVGDLGQQIIDQLMSLDPIRSMFMQTLQTIVQEKNVALYVADPATEAFITKSGIDGALRPGAGDYLLVADSSVGTTKLNLVVQERLTLDISLDAQGTATDVATLGYTLPFTAWSEQHPQLARIVKLPTQYWYADFVRLFVPAGASLRSASLDGERFASAEDDETEGGALGFGRYFVLPVDQARTVSISYSSPGTAHVHDGVLEYRLRLQKQPGTNPVPVHLVVHAPAGFVATRASLDDHALQNGATLIDTTLAEDRDIIITFQQQS